MKFCLPILLICTCSISWSQSKQVSIEKAAKRSIFLELGKTGLIYNIGYDYQLVGRKTGFRALVGSNFGKYQTLFNVGGGIYQLFGKGKRYFETGLDIYYLSVTENSDDQVTISIVYPDYPVKTFYACANIGYRNSSEKKLFRIGIAPGITKDEFIPGGYISFGFRF